MSQHQPVLLLLAAACLLLGSGWLPPPPPETGACEPAAAASAAEALYTAACCAWLGLATACPGQVHVSVQPVLLLVLPGAGLGPATSVVACRDECR